MYLHTLLSLSLMLSPTALVQNSAAGVIGIVQKSGQSVPDGEQHRCSPQAETEEVPSTDGTLVMFLNASDVPVREIYFWNARVAPDEIDLLGTCALAPGQSFTIDLSPEEARACTYRFKVVYNKAESLIQDVNVCSGRVILVKFQSTHEVAPLPKTIPT